MRKAMFATCVTVAALLGMTGAAYAQTDPTGGEFETAVGNVGDWITGTAVGPLFLLAGTVLIVVVAFRWFRKARSQST